MTGHRTGKPDGMTIKNGLTRDVVPTHIDGATPICI